MLLYRLRNSKLCDPPKNITSTNIQKLCKIEHRYGRKEKPYGIRLVEGRLAGLVKKGDIIRENEEEPGKCSRPKYFFSISTSCKEAIEKYVKTPELELSSLIITNIAPRSDENDRRLAEAGIVPCPSCGSPTQKTDMIRIEGAEKDICPTEYFESIKKCIHSCKNEDGSWSETIVGIPGIAAEGRTKDECRNKIMNMMRTWSAEKRSKGLVVPSIPSPQLCLLSDKHVLEAKNCGLK